MIHKDPRCRTLSLQRFHQSCDMARAECSILGASTVFSPAKSSSSVIFVASVMEVGLNRLSSLSEPPHFMQNSGTWRRRSCGLCGVTMSRTPACCRICRSSHADQSAQHFSNTNLISSGNDNKRSAAELFCVEDITKRK